MVYFRHTIYIYIYNFYTCALLSICTIVNCHNILFTVVTVNCAGIAYKAISGVITYITIL